MSSKYDTLIPITVGQTPVSLEDLETSVFFLKPPQSEDDAEGAQHAFIGFLHLYQGALTKVEHYLGELAETQDHGFANAYAPWHHAVRDLLRGIFMIAKKIPLPNPESFKEALRMLSFDSAARLVRDICISCKIAIDAEWATRFRDNILIITQAHHVLLRNQGIIVQR